MVGEERSPELSQELKEGKKLEELQVGEVIWFNWWSQHQHLFSKSFRVNAKCKT